MGSPNPMPDDDSERWWAIRTLCNSTACAANGVELDQLDHRRRKAKGRSAQLQFVEGHWIENPQRTRNEVDECSIADDGTMKKGENTIVPVWQLQPQSDGSFHGMSTATVVTSECGLQGAVYETPFTATRIDEIAVDIAIPDPTFGELPTAPEAVPGPVLTGTYQLTFDFSQTHSGGVFRRGEGVSHEWRAYRSLCTTSGCVATAAMLDDANPTEAAGGGNVLRFIAGSWTDIPYRARITCGPDESLEHTTERSLTLEPLPDNTLRGTSKSRILSNECGAQGSWFEVPVTAVRTGDIPPAVSVADPALFG
jgi:serine/threonine-protein kinase